MKMVEIEKAYHEGKMKRKPFLYVDQYGTAYKAPTIKVLCESLGYSRGSARRMYRDKKDGTTIHVGYVIGPYWLCSYYPAEEPVAPA